jgi:hypothetical protein
MASLTPFVERRLTLQINAERVPSPPPWQRWFLGFTVKNDALSGGASPTKPDPVQTPGARADGTSPERQLGKRMISELVQFLRRWRATSVSANCASWHHWTARLRCVVWVQWKTRGQRYRELHRLNIPEQSASAAVFSPKADLGG